MRIFRQAFEQLGGSRVRTKSDPRIIDNIGILPPEEYFKQEKQQAQPLTRQFFTILSSLEQKLNKECTIDRVNQVVAMYQQCIEYYDSKKDDIKYYFVEKIQNALYEMQQLQCLKIKTEIQSPITTKLEHLSPIAIEEDEHYIRNKKKEKSFKLAIQEQVIQETHQNTQQLQSMVNEYHEKIDQHASIIKKSVIQQDHQFNERLRKRSINKKSMQRCNSSGILNSTYN